MASKLKAPEPNELWPKVLGHGPKLAFVDGQVVIRLSSHENHYTVGQGEGEAALLATYTTQITAESHDSLTMAGRHVTGWLLLDATGQLLARLASDDEVVYPRNQVEAFAALAGLKIKDWGEVPVTRIDKLLAPTDGKGVTRQRISRREWVIALAVAGGILFSWPFASQITFSTERQRALIIFLLGVGGFLFAGIGLALGRLAAKLPPLPIYVSCGVPAAGFAAASLYVQFANLAIWKLTTEQTGAALLGIAAEFAAIIFWSRIQRAGISAEKRQSKLDLH
ncbi:MAG: hypothetical protein LBC29_05000 [Propionibacteriaceae bacterium]|jgi:hypothetical protein|nr:hypothetical protein [Propionibacteriaceae bacterium]